MSMDQEDLNQLKTSLREFTDGLDSFARLAKEGKFGGRGNTASTNTGNSGSANFDKGTEKIVNALGLLSVSLSKSTNLKVREIDAVLKFNKTVEKATDDLEKSSAAAIANGKKATTAKAGADEENIEYLRRKFKEGTNSVKESMGNWAKNIDTKINGAEDNLSVVERTINGIGLLGEGVDKTAVLFGNTLKEVNGFGNSLTRSTNSFESLNTIVGLAGKTVGGLLGMIPIIGDGLSKLSEAATEIAKTMISQFSANRSVFKDLADVGLANSFERMKEMGEESGLMFRDINHVLGKQASNLAQFGGSVANGAKRFTGLSKEMEETRRGFSALGIEAAELAEFQAAYLVREGRLGMIRDQDDKKLRKGTEEYISQLDILSKLTGESRKGIQAKLDESRAETQFASVLEQLKEDPTARAEMESFDIMMRKTFGDDIAKGLRANAGGTPIGEQGTTVFQQTGGKSAEIMLALQNKQIDSIQAMQEIQEAYKRFAGPGTGAVERGVLAGDVGPYKGMSNIYKGVNAKLATPEEKAALIEQQKKDQQRGYDDKTLSGVGAGAAVQVYETGQKLEQAYMNVDVLTTTVGLATTALEKFTEALDEVTGKAGDKPTSKVSNGLSPKPLTSTPGGAAVGNTSMSGATTQGNTNIRPGGLAERAAKANAERAAKSSSGSSAGPTGSDSSQPSSPQSSAKPTQDGGLLDPRLAGLNVKKGDVHKAGEKLDDRIPALAAKIQSEVSGFERFTGFNDAHQRSKGSKHPEGKAVDFTMGYFPTREQGAEIVKQLKDIGFDYALDEYNNPSSRATAPHIHAHVARTGGIFKGPSTGYNVELHGDEAVVPMNDGVSKQALNTSVFNQDTSAISDLKDMFQTMQYKYDQMIDLLSRQADNGDKLVQAAY